jgi:2-polyprenyl-3-methyl-5-hydroxy-6-metoxy-1,4-benzoquinol methylase
MIENFSTPALIYRNIDKVLIPHQDYIIDNVMSIESGDKVLDLGPGTGPMILSVAKKVGSNGFVAGIEGDMDEIYRMEKSISRSGVENVHMSYVWVSEDSGIPYQDNHFDVIYSYRVLCATKNPEHILEDLIRVLKPEGSIYIICPDISTLSFSTMSLEAEHLLKVAIREMMGEENYAFTKKGMSILKDNCVSNPMTSQYTILDRDLIGSSKDIGDLLKDQLSVMDMIVEDINDSIDNDLFYVSLSINTFYGKKDTHLNCTSTEHKQYDSSIVDFDQEDFGDSEIFETSIAFNEEL